MATAPSATPKPPGRGGPGCVVALIALPIVIVIGIVVGTILNRPDEPPQERSVTVEEGRIGDAEWRVDAVRDVEGDICAFLYTDGVELTGACALTPQDATFGDETVVFGRAGPDAEVVEVVLDDGEVVEVPTVTVGGIGGRFYVLVVPRDVDAERLR